MKIFIEAQTAKKANPVVESITFSNDCGEQVTLGWPVVNSTYEPETKRWRAMATEVEVGGASTIRDVIKTVRAYTLSFITFAGGADALPQDFRLTSIVLIEEDDVYAVPEAQLDSLLADEDALDFLMLLDSITSESFEECNAFDATLKVEMLKDEEPVEKKYPRLFAGYANGSDKVRQAIDDTFVCLCGWSLSSLISKALKLNDAIIPQKKR